MTVQLTIIGLGQIGASFGLALAEHGAKIVRLGYDIDPKIAHQAQKTGAVDKTALNPGAAIRGADIVLLALPVDQLREMISLVSADLREGAVLMETAPLKIAVAGWVEDALPAGRPYVGLTPILNPKYLHEERFGLNAARADLFHNGMLAITSPPETGPNAIRLATDLATLVGADPFFADMHEIDGLMAKTHTLPQLMGVALLEALLDKPGWQEARKVAGRAFAEATGPVAHLDDPQALAASAVLDRENVLHALDSAIAALQSIRQEIDRADTPSLETLLGRARAGVHQWWQERGRGGWQAEELPSSEELPTSGDVMSSIFGFGRRRKKKRDG